MDELYHPPRERWNGKLVLVGVAGSTCRSFQAEREALVERGYACAPMSHHAAANVALTELARATLAIRLGTEPHHTILLGLSASGGTALRTATTFPSIFAGVIAGSVVLDPSSALVRLEQLHKLIHGAAGGADIPPGRLAELHATMMAHYDPEDGLLDGILYDPLACAVEPVLAKLSRAAGPRFGDSDAKEPDWLQRVRATYAMGAAPGSEMHWRHASSLESLAAVRAAFLMLDREEARTPSLRAFFEAGGRLIQFHGYNDVVVSPEDAIALFESIERDAGGALEAAKFARLFLWPGLDHDLYGPSEGGVDYIELMDRWLTRTPPRPPDDPMLQRRPGSPGAAQSVFAPTNMDPGDPGFARLNFPFPLRTRFKGRGNADNLKSWYAPGVYRRTREPITASELPKPLPQDPESCAPIPLSASVGPILVIGATGRLGIEIVQALAAHDVAVRAMVRDFAKADRLLHTDAEIVIADVCDIQSFTRAIRGCRRVVFAASATAGGEFDNTPETVEFNGVRHLIAAAAAEKVEQIVLVSSAACTQRDHIHNLWGAILEWKRRSEDLIRASGIPYTILRPTGLRPAPPDWPPYEAGIRGVRFIQGDRIAFGEEIHRADVAQVILGALADPHALGKTFEAYNDDTLPSGAWVGTFSALRGDFV